MRGDRKNSSLPLIALTLVTGVALGWLLRDLLVMPSTRQVALPTEIPSATAAPTREPVVSTAVLVIPTPTLIPAPTYTPQTQPIETSVAPTPDVVASPIPATISVEPEPSPTTAARGVAGYTGHMVAEGETLETIAEQGGSTAEVIARYNRLNGPPQPGQALIVPQLEGLANDLESVPILVERGQRERPWVAFTLDAGAGSEPVPQMLAALQERGVRITFFLTGKWIAENPDLTRAIVAGGHEVANHTFSHPDLTGLDDDAIRRELAETEELLQQTAGATTRPFFRPPFGAYDERVLRVVESEGYLPVYWTLDSLDSVGEPKSAAFLLERVTGKLSIEELRGAIILAHCGSEATADALPQILDRFAAMGLEVRTVSEVLGG